MGRRLLLLLLFLGSARTALADEPDWQALTQEAAQLLSRYVQIDTTNPPGNELAAAKFLKSTLADAGVGATIYPSAENRANLLARLPGTGRDQPIVLLHHMDVVPAEAADWSFPPFGGEIRDGFVSGRGTLDDKGHGVMQLVALLARLREQRPCTRDIVYLAVADEEAGGAMGAGFMLQHHPEQIRAAAVWNEGGASLEGILGEEPVNSVGVTEKNALWITLAATGESGHGSAPSGKGAVQVLVRALERVAKWDTPIHLIPPIREMFGRLGAAMFPGGGFLLRNLDTPLIGELAAGRVTGDPITNGLVRNTIAFTGLRAGIKHNVIPHHAEADLDVRLLPDQQPSEFLADLTRVIDDPRVSILPIQNMPQLEAPSPSDTPFFQSLEKSLSRRLPASITVPGMLTGGSDCTAFRAVGIPCYGYVPMVGTSEFVRRIHGIDERISLDNLRLGIQVTYDVLNSLCTE